MSTKKETAKKAAPKKKIEDPAENSFFTVKTVKEYAWKKIPNGSKFKAKIGKKIVEGRISKYPGSGIYLCQNSVDGDSAPNKMGFKYSVNVWNGSITDLISEDVFDLEITLDPEYKAPSVIRVGDRTVEFFPGYIKVGCTSVKNATVIKIASQLVEAEAKK